MLQGLRLRRKEGLTDNVDRDRDGGLVLFLIVMVGWGG